eukprot:757436-Hanusia_phi.AAC.6
MGGDGEGCACLPSSSRHCWGASPGRLEEPHHEAGRQGEQVRLTVAEVDEGVRQGALYAVDAEAVAGDVALRVQGVLNVERVEVVPPLLRRQRLGPLVGGRRVFDAHPPAVGGLCSPQRCDRPRHLTPERLVPAQESPEELARAV